MNRLKDAIETGKFAWEKYLNGKTCVHNHCFAVTGK